MNSELSMLLWVIIILLVFGIPRIMKKVMLPRELQFEEIPPERLTPQQTEFFDGYDARIRALGYDDCITYRVTNLTSANIGRTYFSSTLYSRCTVAAVTGEKRRMSTSFIEFSSNYSDGTMLETNNTQLSSPFSCPPYRIRQNFPGVTDLAQLKAKHDKRAESLVTRGQVSINRSNFFDQFRKAHQRNCEHQVSQKLMRLDPSGVYRATSRLALRGILKFLNPLSDNFTPARAAAGLFLGAGLPFAVTFAAVPLTVWLSPRVGLTPQGCSLMLTAGAFALAGGALGMLFQHKVFIWALLLGYLPVAFMGSQYGVSFSLLMAWTADLTFRVRSRRAAIA